MSAPTQLALRAVILSTLFLRLAVAESSQPPTPQPGQLPPAQTSSGPQSAPDDSSGALKLHDTMTAPPLTTGGKFNSRVVQTFGVRGVLGTALGASIGQATGTPHNWGGGMEGFGKRYASGFAGNLIRQSLAFGLDAALHEDSRYFPSSSQSTKSRILNSFKQVFMCKTDSGHTSFGYSKVISAFAAGQLINTWQPATNGRPLDGFERGIFSLGGDLGFNLVQEFFPFTRSRSFRNRP